MARFRLRRIRLNIPFGVRCLRVETAQEMAAAVQDHLPVDIAVLTAAVADWRVAHPSPRKIKKDHASAANPPALMLAENPDILRGLAQRTDHRPALVIGFAAETENLLAQARAKREKKTCDWILANDVGAAPEIFGGDETHLHLITAKGEEDWGRLSKTAASARLVAQIADFFKTRNQAGRP